MQQIAIYAFLTQLACTLMMSGLIWMVQLVHYPLMAYVNHAEFTAYSLRHTASITWLVGPLMLAEAVTALVFLYTAKKHLGFSDMWAWLGLGLLLIIWASTAFLQVPCHEVLTQRFDAGVLERLVASNWVRTVAWSLRSCILLYLCGSFVIKGLK